MSIWRDTHTTLQNTTDAENVERNKKKKGENLNDIKLAQIRCQNLSISTIGYL